MTLHQDPTYHVWNNYKHNFKAPGVEFTLRGHAISARSSGFWVEEWRVMFDAGITSPFSPLHIFITHPHSDHAAQLPSILSGISAKPVVYVPAGTAPLFRQLLFAKKQLSNDSASVESDEGVKFTLQEVSAGDSFDICVRGNQPMHVRAFASHHTVRSVGYALFYRRTRLREEFADKSGKELSVLRKDGIDITEETLVPALAYVGDSTPQWTADPLFQQHCFPFIMCECTFVGALEDVQRARAAAQKYGHTCWEDLKALIDNEETEAAKTIYILVHWSNRYSCEDLQRFFAGKPNIHAWTW